MTWSSWLHNGVEYHHHHHTPRKKNEFCIASKMGISLASPPSPPGMLGEGRLGARKITTLCENFGDLVIMLMLLMLLMMMMMMLLLFTCILIQYDDQVIEFSRHDVILN